MSEGDWNGGHAQSLVIFLNGQGIPDRNEVGVRVVDDSFLLLINAHHQQVIFTLPEAAYGSSWDVVVDTADPLLAHARRRASVPGERQRVLGRAMRVLRRRF
jgi:glycogen operon protein